tara:strand:- start:6471 stop:7052 length:582 start_codon:yes stop_codon:yes gene_type:complete
MHIDHQTKIVFIHNPKSGGTSISYAMGGYENGFEGIAHIGPDIARTYLFQDDWDSFSTFTTVRDPWDRYISLYQYQRSEYYGIYTENNYSHCLAKQLTFEEWARHNIFNQYKSNWFGVPQTNWWSGVSNVFKFERMNEIEIYLSNLLKRSVIVPHKNRTDSKKPKMPDLLFDYIYNLEKDTIKLFGYENHARS